MVISFGRQTLLELVIESIVANALRSDLRHRRLNAEKDIRFWRPKERKLGGFKAI